MFSKPHVYAVGNKFQRLHVTEYIKEFKSVLTWGRKPNSSLLDIGCGTGDITIDYVEPLFSGNYEKIKGIDISVESINYAKKTYENKFPRIKFDIMNIADNKLEITELFDHLTTFYCLNFVQDQRQAAKNMYNLLKPGGDFFCVLMARFHVYWALEILIGNPKFGPHILEVGFHASPYRYSKTPAEDFKEVLKEAGFKDIICKANRGSFEYDKEQLNNFLILVDLLKPGTSDELRKEFNKAFLDTMEELNCVTHKADNTYVKFPYRNIVAYAKK